MMKRLFVAALLFASVHYAQAAETIRIQIIGDVHHKFHSMLENQNQGLREGMNLLATGPSGDKLWADVKKEGQSIVVNWVITDKSDRRLPQNSVSISTVQPGTPRSEEKWLVCTEPQGPGGPRVCHEVPCVPKFPCPKWICGK